MFDYCYYQVPGTHTHTHNTHRQADACGLYFISNMYLTGGGCSKSRTTFPGILLNYLQSKEANIQTQASHAFNNAVGLGLILSIGGLGFTIIIIIFIS